MNRVSYFALALWALAGTAVAVRVADIATFTLACGFFLGVLLGQLTAETHDA